MSGKNVVVSARVSAESNRSEEQLVATLAQRIQSLETELSEARARFMGVHSRLMYARSSFYEDEGMQASVLSTAAGPLSGRAAALCRQEAIHIEPLPLHHPLRRKWSLGKGSASAAAGGASARICFTGNHIPGGQMRIFGLLADGEAWEHYVPFSRLAHEGGIIIGRDPEQAHLLLPENGVSRIHARIELGSTGLVISDLNSTNGIRVNDEYINSYSPQNPLTDGSTIRLGDTSLRIELIYGSAEPTH